jgi:hypothetical protein
MLFGYKEKRGYWKLKEEALDRALWRTGFGRGYGLVTRQTTGCMRPSEVRFPNYDLLKIKENARSDHLELPRKTLRC